MTVPASKRTVGRTSYLTACRAISSRVLSIMRRWPKRRSFTEAEHVSRIAFDLLEDIYSADAIYAATPQEAALRLEYLNRAYGKLNTIAGLLDWWYDDPPYKESYDRDQDGNRVAVLRPAVSRGALEALAIDMMKAIRLMKGAIKSARARLRDLESRAAAQQAQGSASFPGEAPRAEPEPNPGSPSRACARDDAQGKAPVPHENRAYPDKRRGQTMSDLPQLGDTYIEGSLRRMADSFEERRKKCPLADAAWAEAVSKQSASLDRAGWVDPS